MSKLKIAFQGEPGANSDIAAREAYPGCETDALRDLRGRARGDLRAARPISA